MTDNAAPDFNPNYPSAGVRVGPAWRWLWGALVDREWHVGIEIAARCARACDVNYRTAENLMYSAKRAGVLESDYESRKGANGVIRKRVRYRRIT